MLDVIGGVGCSGVHLNGGTRAKVHGLNNKLLYLTPKLNHLDSWYW